MASLRHTRKAVPPRKAGAVQNSARNRPGIVDVASLAGVSHITVSRVINNFPGIRPTTRERVLVAMRRLDYQPNAAARALVTGTSRTIGVICYNTARYGTAAALLGLEQAAREIGYSVNIVGLQSLDDKFVKQAVDRLRQQAIAGIVIVSPQAMMVDAAKHLPRDIPTVAIWGHTRSPVPVVTADDATGAAQATQHLIDLGHRNVWHVAGPRDRISAAERIRGWRTTLMRAELNPPPILYGDWTAQSGYLAGKALAADTAVSAVFVAGDQMALGVLRAFHEMGRSVPQDISVVGFDDIPEAAYYTPPLTTVRQNFTELGGESMTLLLELMKTGRPRDCPHIIRPTELVIRCSTGAPRS